MKFDDGTTEAIDFREDGIRITREAPAPAPAPVAPPPAAAAPAPIEIWQPGPGYASVFPSNATGVAFLRADLNGPGAAATA